MITAPICPQCNVQMKERQNRSTGTKFYGCPNFPKCEETARHEDDEDDSFVDHYGARQDD